MKDKYGFPQTHHSMINRIQVGDDETRSIALTEFTENYRKPLFDYLVKCRSIKPTDAEDLVQEFFLLRIMTGKVLTMNNGEGRFRGALRTCLRNFLIDKVRKEEREGVERYFDGDLDEDSEIGINPIDLVWATALFRTSLTRMKNESSHWELFFDRVLTQPPLPYEQVIERHGYSSPDVAANRLVTAKRQFNRILNECVGSQSHLSGVSNKTEYQQEIELLAKLLEDSNMISEIVSSLDEPMKTKTANESIHQHSILGEHVLFVDESPEKSWDKSDAESMIRHLLEQPVSQFVNCDSDTNQRTVSDVLFGDINHAIALSETKALKDYFNERGQQKRSQLPERIDVTITFTMIARFIVLGGEVEDITSMRRDVLTQRLGQLLDKDWILREIRDLIGRAVAKLLS